MILELRPLGLSGYPICKLVLVGYNPTYYKTTCPLVILHSYWKLQFIVDLPIQNRDFLGRYFKLA